MNRVKLTVWGREVWSLANVDTGRESTQVLHIVIDVVRRSVDWLPCELASTLVGNILSSRRLFLFCSTTWFSWFSIVDGKHCSYPKSLSVSLSLSLSLSLSFSSSIDFFVDETVVLRYRRRDPRRRFISWYLIEWEEEKINEKL